MSKHTPTPWFFVPWHVEEGQSAVRAGSVNGWLIASTSSDDDAQIIATAVNSYDSLRSINKELVEACGPLLNEKALKLVGETAEASRGMNDIGLAIALEMLLTNHEKRRAVLTRAKSLT